LISIQVADTGPEPRADMSLNPNAEPVVLFGGISSLDPNAAPAPTVFGDTWEWTAQGWAKTQDIGPAARYGHGAAGRRSAPRLVLFGGATQGVGAGSPAKGSDTWELPDQLGPGGGVAPQIVSVTMRPQFISSAQPFGEIAAIDVVMSAPPPAGATLQVTVLPVLPAGSNGMVANPPPFDGQQPTITFPLIFQGGGMILLHGTYGVSVTCGTGGAAVIGQFQIG
jgi:hypothetical protein